MALKMVVKNEKPPAKYVYKFIADGNKIIEEQFANLAVALIEARHYIESHLPLVFYVEVMGKRVYEYVSSEKYSFVKFKQFEGKIVE